VTSGNGSTAPDFDAVVVGAGFAGLYLLHKLRGLGFSVRVYEQADDVGGTWYWNRYPGARCDIPTTDYTYSFDPELEKEWTWSEKYAAQPEILRYLDFVANRYDLRPDISFETRVDSAAWDDAARVWRLVTSRGDRVACRFYIPASGCLSLPKDPDIEGASRFRGEVYFTGRWPHEKVDFTGKRVAVIGTGSSGIQSIPLIAEEASELVVFQRTPNFSTPAHNGAPPADRLARIAEDRDTYRETAKWSRGGVPIEPTEIMALTATEEVRRQRFEEAWEAGELFAILNVFADQGVNPAANDIISEMIREKIRSIVKDPETAEALCPKDHYFGTKRPCLDTNYYATYNKPHVRLVDLRKHPIKTITETGLDTVDESFEFDAIVYAIGFDAMTGPLVAVNVTGKDGVTLKHKWAEGPSTYLGLTTVGFPNFFMITGPGSPSVLSNMTVSIEQHVDWVADCMVDMRAQGFDVIEPTPLAETGWDQHVQDCAAITLHPTANSWYMGANVPGKPRVFYPYIGGVDRYRAACDEVRASDYLGFHLSGPGGKSQLKDGVVRSIQPDVAMVLETMEAMGAPRLETLSPADARAFMEAAAAMSPPGPEVGEIVDGVIPLASGVSLEYRLFRPSSGGPHPIILYFHGGGWVLGSATADDPFCRDLCVQTDAVVISANYRHAPEHVFPAAADDAYGALEWVSGNAIELGGIPGQLVVAGWSAGGNVAAVACQRALSSGSGIDISGQFLLTPVVDCDMSRPSYVENAEGYGLTAPLMKWFWDLYCPSEQDRLSPVASPLRAPVSSLSGLPPAVIVTADFDPLRDEGLAYVAALEEAGVPVQHIRARGHTHTSLTMVDLVISAVPVRAEIAGAIKGLFPASVRA
jgi:cation diffusion facilitator CzcD-associated flavoprotein CzcO/acetyl esterase/lipase